ncbi:MAG: hypothetical protein M3526_02390, partial [Actinomycetota bacterium]|nr:hypothetical protein [Actinomycetota bacterium]
RWRVVIITVALVVLATSLLGWGVGKLLRSRETADMIANAEPAKLAIMNDHGGEYTCNTPEFTLGRFEVALLRALPMPKGGWALHLVVHGKAPLASGTGRFMAFVPVGADPVQIPAQAETTWTDAFPLIPKSLGDRFDIQLRDLHGELVGTFPVDTAKLECDFS